MSSIRVLVVGSGQCGAAILDGLCLPQFAGHFKPALLVRPASLHDPKQADKLKKFRSSGIQIVEGDSDGEANQLITALTGFHTVISAVGQAGLRDAQLRLIEASKAAGVRRFLPCEFGIDTAAISPNSFMGPLPGYKVEVAKAVEKSGLDYILIKCGIWTHFFFSPISGIDTEKLIVNAPGSLDTKATVTTIEDMGRFTAEILSRNLHGIVKLSGQTLSYREAADILEKVKGKPVTRNVRTKEQLLDLVAKNPSDFTLKIQLVWAEQEGTNWDHNQAWNVKQGLPTTSAQDWAAANLK